MNKRQQQIIAILSASDSWVKGGTLSKRLNVTDRTIRSDIDAINNAILDLIESNTRKGYRLVNTDLLSNVIDSNANQIPQTPEERTFYIIKRLLFVNKSISIYELQEQLFVSDHTIESDIKRIRKLIKPYPGIVLVRANNYIYFDSNEATKRKLYRDLIYIEIHGNFMNLNKIASHYDKFNLISVVNLLQSVIESHQYVMRDSALPLIMLHIGIMTERMVMGYCLSGLNLSDDVDVTSQEYCIAHEFLEKLAQMVPIKYNEQEIAEVSNLLLGYKNATTLEPFVTVNETIYSIPKCINTITAYLNSFFGIDLATDQDFRAGLHLHLQSLVNRINKKITVQNTYLQEVKMSYPLIFEMAVHVSRIVSDFFNIYVSEAETGFISLHLGAAYERNMQQERYRALLITSSSQSFAHVTKEKLESKFKDRMEIISIKNYFETDEIECDNVDLLICVPHIQHHLDIPTVKISMFVNNEDESLIFSTLNALDHRRTKLDFAQKLSVLIEDTYFYPKQSWETPEIIISEMSHALIRDGYVAPSFKDSVLEREAYAATSFEIGLATPHPLIFEGTQSILSIATLTNPVRWGNYDVKMVILLSFAGEERETMETFFNWLSNIISNRSKLDKLISAKSRDEFVYWMLEEL